MRDTNTKKKVGVKTSYYRLYVRFKPEYQGTRKDFNYFSDDRINPEHGLKLLMRRVLYGTCKGRFDLAMLYEVHANTCIKVFTPWLGETSYEAFKEAIKHSKKRCLFKAYVICIDLYIDTLIQKGKRHPIIIPGEDIDLVTGKQDPLIAFQNFHKLTRQGELKGNIKAMHIYDQQDRRVAIFSGDGAITFLNQSLQKTLSSFFKSIH